MKNLSEVYISHRIRGTGRFSHLNYAYIFLFQTLSHMIQNFLPLHPPRVTHQKKINSIKKKYCQAIKKILRVSKKILHVQTRLDPGRGGETLCTTVDQKKILLKIHTHKADVVSTLITQKLVRAIWGLRW